MILKSFQGELELDNHIVTLWNKLTYWIIHFLFDIGNVSVIDAKVFFLDQFSQHCKMLQKCLNQTSSTEVDIFIILCYYT